MFKKFALLTIPLLLLVARVASADPPRQIPLFLNYQSALIDEGGNPLQDGTTNFKFRIMDTVGTILYEESQDLEVVKGQISAIVGNGINPSNGAGTGGIPADVFDPIDSMYLQVEVAGQKPYDPLEIVTVPYSLWADTALKLPDGAITSDMIGKGVITKDHLDAELIAAIFPDGIPKAMLPSDTLYTGTFDEFKTTMLSSYGAARIGVVPDFIYSSAQSVQGVLKDLDLAVRKRQTEVNVAKAEAKEGLDKVDTKNVDKAGDTMSGLLEFTGIGEQVKGAGWSINSSGALSTSSASVTSNLTAGSVTSSGALNAASASVTNNLTAGSITSSGALNAGATTVNSLDAGAGQIKTTGALNAGTTTVGQLTAGTTTVSSLNAGTGEIKTLGLLKTGGMTVTTGNIVLDAPGATVDGVDIGGHVSSTNTAAHKFSNISGTIADTQISSEITRDTELDDHAKLTSAHGSDGAVVGANTLATHTGATSAHGSNGTVVGLNTLTSYTSVKVDKRGDTMSGNLLLRGGSSVPTADSNTKVLIATNSSEGYIGLRGGKIYSLKNDGALGARLTPIAYGLINPNYNPSGEPGESNYTCLLLMSYNVSSISKEGSMWCEVHFPIRPDANYIITVSVEKDCGGCDNFTFVKDRTRSSFQITEGGYADALVHFVVFDDN